MPLHWWLDKQRVGHGYNEKPLHNKKEWNTERGPSKHYAKWKEWDAKLIHFIYIYTHKHCILYVRHTVYIKDYVHWILLSIYTHTYIYTLYDSIYMKYQKRQICRDWKHISSCLGLGVWTDCKTACRNLWGDRISRTGLWSWWHSPTNLLQIIKLYIYNGIANSKFYGWKFYLSKAVFKKLWHSLWYKELTQCNWRHYKPTN